MSVQIPDAAVQAGVEGYRGHATHDSAIRAALTAALPHLQLGYEVKKLEWVEVSYGFIAHTAFGTYKVSFNWGGHCKTSMVIAGGELPKSFHADAEEAKAAAQADFERRVRECMVDKPVDVAAVWDMSSEWLVKWYGSEPMKGASIWSATKYGSHGDILFHIGEDKKHHELAHAIINAHNSTIRSLSAEPARGEQWQPIETAPKDTTEIIVLCGQKDIRLGWYFAPSSQTFGWFDQRQRKINPTHWMPLPAAPTSEAVR